MKLEIKTLLKEARCVQKSRKHSTKRCPDQFVGILKYNSQKNFEWIKKVMTKNQIGCERINITKEYEQENDKAIVMVLESPHLDEYNNKLPKGPAFGVTGKNINKWFENILNDALENEVFESSLLNLNCNYDFIIVNAVQYQTSLGVDTKIYRDACFLWFWEKEKVRNEFKNRIKILIKKYGKDNIILVNCCTKGYHIDLVTGVSGKIDADYLDELDCRLNSVGETTLKRYVSDEITQFELIQYYATHPASWYSKNNRKWGIRRNM